MRLRWWHPLVLALSVCLLLSAPTATATATPTATPTATATPTPTPTATGTPGNWLSGAAVVDIPVRAGSDDAEQASGSSADLTSSDLELVADGTKVQTVGLRFTGVNVAKGSTITGAYVQFQVDEATTATANLTVAGQAADNPGTFTTAVGNVTNRTPTQAKASWTPTGWSTVGARAEAQRTPNLSSVVQEIVNRSNWASGNAMVMLVTGTGTRTAEAFESGAASAAVLHIEYGSGSGGGSTNQPPVVDAGPAELAVTMPNAATLAGSVTDDGLPTGSTVTAAWTKVSGPGDVSFANAAAASTSATFSAAGDYVLRLTGSDGTLTATDDVLVKVTSSTPTGTPGSWLSGATNIPFGTWRGDPIDSITTWHDNEQACQEQWTLTGQFSGWNGPLITAIGGAWADGGAEYVDWSAVASGSHDAIWRNCLNEMKADWGSRPAGNLYISLFHEANGSWYDWSVAAEDVADFKASFHRFRVLQKEILPAAKLIFAPNADHVPPGPDYALESMLPAPADYDALAFDIYSMHSLSKLSQFPGMAQRAGKSLIVQEWGIKNDEGGGASWVQGMRDWIAANAGTGPGKVLMENYFDIGDYRISSITSSPDGAARYRALW